MATEMVTNSARAEVLRRIRAAKGGASERRLCGLGGSAMERGYRAEASRMREVMIELLEDRLRDYDAHVVRVGRGEVAVAVGEDAG